LNEKPEHEVLVETFRLDSQEVSAKNFSAFLNEKGNPDDRYFSCDKSSTIMCINREGKQTYSSGKDVFRYLPRPGYENYPANNVSWYGADAFCLWKGKRLATEAEWEKAAKGDDRRIYPWGNKIPDESLARLGQDRTVNSPDVMVPVDALPEGASYYGALNMGGNVMEWVSDWYRQNYCEYCDPSGAEYLKTAEEIIFGNKEASALIMPNESELPPRKDPKGPVVGSFRVLRGGSWYDSKEMAVRSATRFWLDPAERHGYTGLRCASTSEKAPPVNSK
jgi:formylglycine-generating enzyme required for sulfatase activity